MANDEEQGDSPTLNEPQNAPSDSDSDSDYDSDYSYDEAEEEALRRAFRLGDDGDDGDDAPMESKNNNPEENLKAFSEALESPAMKELQEEMDPLIAVDQNPYDFPKDTEEWTEQDLRELWADGPLEIGGTGWDPVWATEDEWRYVREQIADGEDPPIAPFYLPYRKHYPPIPDNHYDIATPKDAIEELDRIEEFLKWVSYVFEDGSTYVYPTLALPWFLFMFRFSVVCYMCVVVVGFFFLQV